MPFGIAFSYGIINIWKLLQERRYYVVENRA